MSNFIRDTRLTRSDKSAWRVAKRNEHAWDYIVQKSPSNRARCRKCSQMIDRGELRIGIPIKHAAGENGWISAWQHLVCTRIDDTRKIAETMFGYDKLTDEQKRLVLREVSSTEMPEHLRSLDVEDLVRRGKLVEMHEPITLLRPLLPYQREGLGWMVRQEEGDIHGGILADEMGMGKTIQMISLLLSRRVSGPTLIVCPVSSMLQWESEIKDHTVPGTLSVLVVYRTTKITTEEMEQADVVLTTYPMLEQAWRGLINSIKVKCLYCNQLFIPRQLVVHNRYFCGPRARRTMKQQKREKQQRQSSGAGTRKVQSAATIRKGLRTLHVEVDDEDEEESSSAVNGPNARVGTKRETTSIEPLSIKKACNDGARRPNSAVTTTTATTEGAQDGSSAKQSSSTRAARGVVGPMGMYEELMREAGRKVRSRWDAARYGKASSDSSSSNHEDEHNTDVSDEETSSSSGSSSSVASSRSASDNRQTDSDNDKDEAECDGAKDTPNALTLKSFACNHCGFQLLRFPFCPKTGQYHVLNESMKKVIDNDTGGDEVNLQASPFHKIQWARVVLDEAHRIKGRTTSTARSAFALSAQHRWCLTGTPLQNRVGELYSLLRFLRMKPYAYYYCSTEGCSCSSLSHPFSSSSLHQCIFCGHGPLQHFAYFNKHILNPITRYGYIGDGRKGMIQLNNDVFTKAMLRRTKTERAEDLHLPPLEICVRKITLSDEERNFYESLYKKSTADFDTFVRKGTVLHNYAHIFQLLSRLRQALDHPLLVVKNMNAAPIVNQKGVCGICSEAIMGESAIHVSPCRHTFHRLCLGQFLESAPDQKFHCPTCFVKINIDLRQLRVDEEDGEDPSATAALPPELEEELNEPDMLTQAEEEDQEREDCTDYAAGMWKRESNDGVSSRRATGNSKVAEVSNCIDQYDKDNAIGVAKAGTFSEAKAAVQPTPTRTTQKVDRGILSRVDPSKPLHGTKLNAIVDYVQCIPRDEKVIIFSQFGDMLDLTQYWLQRCLIKSVKLCGSLTLTQRQAVLQAFLHDPSVRVILISLKAGGEGLNLQVANHVVLVDPWWNPAVEMQAVQRAHRIGQRKHVKAVRFETVNSVEERMIELQDKKMLVFEGTIDGKMQSLSKLTEQDLQFLFTR